MRTKTQKRIKMSDNLEDLNQYFTITGSEDYLDCNKNPRVNNDSSEHVLAKKLYRDNGTHRYCIKLDNNGKI